MFISMMLVSLVTILFMIISYTKLMEVETFSAYECGFSMTSYVRMFFSFRFFLICILFLIFDVEIVLMLPIPFMVMKKSIFSISFMFFIFILIVGLLYEYYYGSLNWLNFISKA